MPKKKRWNELPCPECKEPIAIDAKRCQYCGHELSEAEKSQRAGAKKATYLGCGGLVVIAILSLTFCSGDAEIAEADGTEMAAEIAPALPLEGSASPEVQAAFDLFYGDVMSIMQPCDIAGSELADAAGQLAAGNSSMYDGYSAATTAARMCENSWKRVDEIAVPEVFDRPTEAATEKAIETCSNAMLTKQMGAETMQEIFDGDMRPSKMQELTDNAAFAQAGILACIGDLFGVATISGSDISVMARED